MKIKSLRSNLSHTLSRFAAGEDSGLNVLEMRLPSMPDLGLRAKLKASFTAAAAEAHLIEDGVLHMKDADHEIRENFHRDLATCATETGLAIAQDVAAEVTFAVAAFETGEKIAHTPHNKISYRDLAAEFIESITSSTCAAIHSAVNLFHDIESAGQQWEAKHPRIF
ncbi:MAG TPA: hypothetical protein EYG18_02880 [Micavibrio sp.]|nr:hypothetical protein [Micavibrio sp.]HIL28191.1 hypothetical protein [Micavibrio sp.]